MIVPRLRSPVVLVHGVLGFDEVRLGPWTLVRYFRDIPDVLRAAGNCVLVACLSPTGGVAQRAAQLRQFLDRHVGTEPVHLFSHSMGGLDSRYLISRLNMADRVLSLTTIGTPHRGSPFADWGIRRFARLLRPLFDCFHIPGQAFYDLTTTSCRKFNEEVPDSPKVRYFSVAGCWEGCWPNPGWTLPARIVTREEGPNDGVVSVSSATYGESVEIWDADHVGLVNWPNPAASARGLWKDRGPYYAGLVRRLKDEGF